MLAEHASFNWPCYPLSSLVNRSLLLDIGGFKSSPLYPIHIAALYLVVGWHLPQIVPPRTGALLYVLLNAVFTSKHVSSKC